MVNECSQVFTIMYSHCEIMIYSINYYSNGMLCMCTQYIMVSLTCGGDLQHECAGDCHQYIQSDFHSSPVGVKFTPLMEC